MKIVVTKISRGYSAQLDGQPSFVGIGQSVDEAIGHFVRCNRDIFNVTVQDKSQEEKPRGEEELDAYPEEQEENARDYCAQQELAQRLPSFLPKGDNRFFT